MQLLVRKYGKITPFSGSFSMSNSSYRLLEMKKGTLLARWCHCTNLFNMGLMSRGGRAQRCANTENRPQNNHQ